MESQIVALPQSQHGWTYDGETNTAEPVTLIAFRERDDDTEYLAQTWRGGGMFTYWISIVCTKEEAERYTNAYRQRAWAFSARDAA